MARRPPFLALIFALPLAGVPVADAGLVTVTFSGEITYVDDPGNLLLGAVLEGDPFRGSYKFDPDATDQLRNPNIGVYTGAVAELSWSVGTLEFHSLNGVAGTIRLENSPDANSRDIYRVMHQVTLGGHDFRITIALFDSSRTLLVSDELPPVPPELPSAAFVEFSHPSYEGLLLSGRLNTFVPEPSTLLLLLGSLLTMRPRDHRRRHRTRQH